MKYLIMFKLSMLIFLVFYFINCNNKKGKFEFLLDEYIDYYNINKMENYLVVNSNKWTDTTSITVVKYKYIAKDKLKLPEEAFKSSYKNISIYFTGSLPLPITNGLYFDKIITQQEEDKDEPYNEYFNDIQIVYYPKCDCFFEVINNSKTGAIFTEKLKRKGIICNSFPAGAGSSK